MDKTVTQKESDQPSTTTLALKKQRSSRALSIRKFLGLTRKYIEDKYAIKESTIQTWETVSIHSTGMTDAGARKLASVYQAEGLSVTAEWIMYGIGEPPPGIVNAPNTNPVNDISQELKTFYQTNRHAIHQVIKDDALAPWLMPGDYVAGSWLFGDEINEALHYPAIIQLDSGEILIRVLVKAKKNQHYKLLCLNPKTSVKQAIVDNVKLLSVAPILWIRKLKINKNFLQK